MESVFNMLRPLHFVLLAAFAYVAFASTVENKEATASFQETAPQETPVAPSDLETDASAYWGYGGRPYYGGGGWGGGWGGRYYPGGWRGGYYGGRGWGRGWGGYGGGYWG